MKLSSVIVASLSVIMASVGRAADATTPVDFAQRNTPFVPAPTVLPDKKELPRDDTVQDKRIEKAIIDKKSATVGDRRAPISVEETREKNIREKTSSRPEVVEQPMSTFNHRDAALTTSADMQKPQLLSKYQDSLAAASTSNMARFPALDRATTAKINRFVFLKNPQETTPLTADAPVTSAGGTNPIRK